ncbi:MAG TPA: glutamate synthase subunit beta [Bacteroidota bacterium]|nr:glutamate synthase subunit beta [Bacteroidota bacterium]
MGKPGGFLEYPRIDPTYRPVTERIHDYREFVNLLPEKEAVKQGARCMDCGVPFCHWLGCPLHNVIPNWNEFVYRRRWKEAYEALEATSCFPELISRVCPGLCEAACTLSINISPVSIRQIELFISERAFENGWVTPKPPAVETNKKVAIVGSGPSGLAAAQKLRRLGHTVTIFERAKKLGGILRYGIPDFKLEKRVIDRRLAQLEAEGVSFAPGIDVGKDLSAEELRRTHDAVILTLGAGEARDLKVPGRELPGIHQAMEYLSQSNRYVEGSMKKEEMIWAEGKSVLVIGGGDTGNDCAGTAIRQGAREVYQFELLPKPREWDKPFNPDWPDWPKILRHSSSHEEGCSRDWSLGTKSFTGSRGRVSQGNFVRLDWTKKSHGAPYSEVAGSEFTLDVDLVLLAMGFVHVEHSPLVKDLQLALDERGNVKTSGGYATSSPGVFVAGDAMTGASLVVRAVAHGSEAAAACHEYLARQN